MSVNVPPVSIPILIRRAATAASQTAASSPQRRREVPKAGRQFRITSRANRKADPAAPIR
jgi:hypothetical protein